MKSLKELIVFIVLVTVLVSCGNDTVNNPRNKTVWSGSGKDSLRQARANGEVLPPFGALWVHRINGLGISSASVGEIIIDEKQSNTSQQVAFVAGGEKSIIAVVVDTGELLWESVFMAKPSSPVYDDGKLVFISDDGTIQCLSADTGNRLWALKFINDPTKLSYEVSEPVISGGLVFFCASNGLTLALNLDDGKEVWRAQGSDRINSSPVVVEGKLIIADYSNKIYTYKTHSGEPLWTEHIDQPVIAQLCSDGQSVYATGAFGGISALDVSDGQVIWNADIDAPVIHSSCIYGNSLYVPTQNSKVVRINKADGGIIGEYNTKEPSSGLVCTDNYVMFNTVDGKLEAINVDTEEVELAYEFATWKPEVGMQSFGDPAVVSGKVFVSDGQSKFFCLVPKEIAMKSHEVNIPDDQIEKQQEVIP
jgi:outer membrane protein assembly factor BamB